MVKLTFDLSKVQILFCGDMSASQYELIGQRFAEMYHTTLGQMFGKPCLKTNNQAFAAFQNGRMIFKLGEENIPELKEKFSGSENWDPSGKNRPMKDWLQVPVEHSAMWDNLAQLALKFVKQ